jgi:hypothetical protein
MQKEKGKTGITAVALTITLLEHPIHHLSQLAKTEFHELSVRSLEAWLLRQ